MTPGLAVVSGETASESCDAGWEAYCTYGSEECMRMRLVQILSPARCAGPKSAMLLRLRKRRVGNPTRGLWRRGKLWQVGDMRSMSA
jgi:hypothetical protein